VLLEGTHLLQELLLKGAWLQEVIATDHWMERHHQLLENLDQRIPIRRVTEEVLRAALSTVTPDGVACLCPLECFPSPPLEASFQLLLDRIQDPAQLGYGCSNSKGYAGINDSVVPIGGLYAMNFSLELRRYFVDDTYGLVVFGDMGMVFLDQDELVSEWNRWRDSRPNLSSGDPFLAPTVGLGLRYNTPIGPVRVDGGYRLDNDERYLFEQKFRFHLALGETF
jgi:hypothetical protein